MSTVDRDHSYVHSCHVCVALLERDENGKWEGKEQNLCWRENGGSKALTDGPRRGPEAFFGWGVGVPGEGANGRGPVEGTIQQGGLWDHFPIFLLSLKFQLILAKNMGST